MSWTRYIAALFATASAVNSGLYGQMGTTWDLAEKGVLPPVFGQNLWKSGTHGVLIVTIAVLLIANFLNLPAIASPGSAFTLLV